MIKALYVPGLGDRRPLLIQLQKRWLRHWRRFGIEAELFAVEWANNAPFQERYDELIEKIDEWHDNGHEILLVGASAGASAVIAAYADRTDKVIGVVSICGQLCGDEKVLDPALDINPRFRESLQQMEACFSRLDEASRRRIITYRPLIDLVVSPRKARLRGAHNHRIPVIGHLLGIMYVVFWGRLTLRRDVRYIHERFAAR